MDKLKLAEVIAKGAHLGQEDKGGNPYYLHLKTVASMVNTDEEKTVAWLHDIVEDTYVTLTDLQELGFDYRIIRAVEAITKQDDETRVEYLTRVKANPLARRVKLADLEHNSDLSRLQVVRVRDIERREKYQQEIAFLQS